MRLVKLQMLAMARLWPVWWPAAMPRVAALLPTPTYSFIECSRAIKYTHCSLLTCAPSRIRYCAFPVSVEFILFQESHHHYLYFSHFRSSKVRNHKPYRLNTDLKAHENYRYCFFTNSEPLYYIISILNL